MHFLILKLTKKKHNLKNNNKNKRKKKKARKTFIFHFAEIKSLIKNKISLG